MHSPCSGANVSRETFSAEASVASASAAESPATGASAGASAAVAPAPVIPGKPPSIEQPLHCKRFLQSFLPLVREKNLSGAPSTRRQEPQVSPRTCGSSAHQHLPGRAFLQPQPSGRGTENAAGNARLVHQPRAHDAGEPSVTYTVQSERRQASSTRAASCMARNSA